MTAGPDERRMTLLPIVNNEGQSILLRTRGVGSDPTLSVDRYCDRCGVVTPHLEAVAGGEFVQRLCVPCGSVTSALDTPDPTTRPGEEP